MINSCYTRSFIILLLLLPIKHWKAYSYTKAQQIVQGVYPWPKEPTENSLTNRAIERRIQFQLDSNPQDTHILVKYHTSKALMSRSETGVICVNVIFSGKLFYQSIMVCICMIIIFHLIHIQSMLLNILFPPFIMLLDVSNFQVYLAYNVS